MGGPGWCSSRGTEKDPSVLCQDQETSALYSQLVALHPEGGGRGREREREKEGGERGGGGGVEIMERERWEE